MRTSDRASVFVLSLLLVSVSCAVAPTGVVEDAAPRFFDVDRDPPSELVRAETAEIALLLRDRETGLLTAEVRHLARVIVIESHRVGLPPAFVFAVIEVESGGRNFAVSNVGARGLMQILPTTGEFVAGQIGVPWRGPNTLFDPAANIRLGVRYLVYLIERYPDLRTALAAYNWGPGKIARRVRRGETIPSTYADRVLATYAGTARAI
jgi:soluble lytic murein transglycosylase-like protein